MPRFRRPWWMRLRLPLTGVSDATKAAIEAAMRHAGLID